MRDVLARAWRLCGYLPITVAVVAGVSWYFLEVGITDTATRVGLVTLVNPLWHLTSMVIHDGWSHFVGNMWLFVPFGVVLTLLTTNRHVLAVVLVSHVLASVVWVATAIGPVVGSSLATFGVVAATLVRATGYALQNASMESLQAMVVGLLAPVLAAFFVITLVAGQTWIAHFAHFLAFLFGGAMEAMYVFSAHETDEEGRSIPKRVGF